jgi:type II secretory pathway component PulM
MPDEPSDKIIQLLEEIRDLTKLRNDKLETMVQDNRKRAEEQTRRHEEFQQRVLARRRLFLLISGPLLLLAIGLMIYLAFWVIPGSEARQTEQQMQEYRMMQSNYLAQPH